MSHEKKTWHCHKEHEKTLRWHSQQYDLTWKSWKLLWHCTFLREGNALRPSGPPPGLRLVPSGRNVSGGLRPGHVADGADTRNNIHRCWVVTTFIYSHFLENLLQKTAYTLLFVPMFVIKIMHSYNFGPSWFILAQRLETWAEGSFWEKIIFSKFE